MGAMFWMKPGDRQFCGVAIAHIESGNFLPFLALFSFFFPCTSVGTSATCPQCTLSIGVELVGLIGIPGDYESKRCEAVDMETGCEPHPDLTTTLVIYTIAIVISNRISMACF